MTLSRSYFHVGLVVDNLDTAMKELSAAGRLEWRKVMEFPIRFRDGDVVVKARSRAVYSAGPAPAIELFESIPGTALSAGSTSFHHMGHWSDDLPADVAHLESVGWDLIATVPGADDKPSQFALHKSPFGFYLELCEVSVLRPILGDLLPPEFA